MLQIPSRDWPKRTREDETFHDDAIFTSARRSNGNNHSGLHLAQNGPARAKFRRWRGHSPFRLVHLETTSVRRSFGRLVQLCRRRRWARYIQNHIASTALCSAILSTSIVQVLSVGEVQLCVAAFVFRSLCFYPLVFLPHHPACHQRWSSNWSVLLSCRCPN